MSLRRLLCISLTMSCLLISGCAEITVGPRVETKTVIMHPGNPLQILENQKLKARSFDNTVVTVDVGGWVAMDPDHWHVIAKKLGAKEVPENVAEDQK